MRTSIICLIYKSTTYAKFFYENLHRYTPEIGKDAEFFFVANDATEEVLDFLKENDYPHIVAKNIHHTDDDLRSRGHSHPSYISRVYQGVNKGIRHSQASEIAMMNSDNFVSPEWLPNLRKRLHRGCVVSPVLVQPHAQFQNPINGSLSMQADFGRSLGSFMEREESFVNWVETVKSDSVSVGNPYMPVLMYKWQCMLTGMYPEGNIGNFTSDGMMKYAGDTYFYMKLNALGIQHINSNDSWVYHLQEGELYNK